MTFHISPRNQGQIVEVAYAATHDGRVVRRVIDRSDRSVTYAIARMLAGDEGDYWQTTPRNQRWQTISESDVDRLAE